MKSTPGSPLFQCLFKRLLDVLVQVRLVLLDRQQVVRFHGAGMVRAAMSFWQPMASIVTSGLRDTSGSSCNNAGMAVISLDLPSTARWPNVR